MAVRFIIRGVERIQGAEFTTLSTTTDPAVLARALLAGGVNRETGDFERYELVGAEVVAEEKEGRGDGE